MSTNKAASKPHNFLIAPLTFRFEKRHKLIFVFLREVGKAHAHFLIFLVFFGDLWNKIFKKSIHF